MFFYKFFLFFIIYISLIEVCLGNISVSEVTKNNEFCELAAKDDLLFKDFKNRLEFASYEVGLHYLNFIRKEYPDLLLHFDRFRKNDLLGNPQTYIYEDIGSFSPTTLRFVKVFGDLNKHFGNLSQLHIAEIGGGYGGLCAILSEMGAFANYTIIHSPAYNELTKKYLSLLGVQNVNFIDIKEIDDLQKYDLVISNYDFSEMDKELQGKCIEKIIKNSANGYFTFNFISSLYGIESIPVEYLISTLLDYGRSGILETEHPLTHPDNLLLVWKTPEKKQKSVNQKSNLLVPKSSFQEKNAITYNFSGGRFGDNLVAYLHAKWISYKYNIPLLYKSFPFSEHLMLSNLELHQGDSFKFRNIQTIFDLKGLKFSTPSSTLFILPYFPECEADYETFLKAGKKPFQVDWEDPDFKTEIRKNLSPKNKINTISLPEGYITVAVHIRRSGGVDAPIHFTWFPLKFPPDSYYIKQIKRIANIYKDKPLYVYIFTDDLHPQKILDFYSKQLSNYNIYLDYNKGFHGPNVNVLEDFYSMSKFDCLIRCQSNFSLMATQLGDFSIVITPLHGTEFHINREEMIFKKVSDSNF